MKREGRNRSRVWRLYAEAREAGFDVQLHIYGEGKHARGSLVVTMRASVVSRIG